jgi:predicted  nucleic acid-binding Zn-ribbon protein
MARRSRKTDEPPTAATLAAMDRAYAAEEVLATLRENAATAERLYAEGQAELEAMTAANETGSAELEQAYAEIATLRTRAEAAEQERDEARQRLEDFRESFRISDEKWNRTFDHYERERSEARSEAASLREELAELNAASVEAGALEVTERMRLEALLNNARAEAAALRVALTNALEGMRDMRGYVNDYFAEKWGHDDYIKRAEKALAAPPAGPAKGER